jgi:MinD-like ATPase involved in chromosome partitioning or flagellar assembly
MESGSNGQATTRQAHLVGIHSCRGGIGKTTLAANLAFLMAKNGARVAIVDGDLQAPSLHHALGLDAHRILHSLSEFVLCQCEIDEVPIDLSRELGLEGAGRLYFLPATAELKATASILFDGYDVARLNKELLRLAAELDLDFVVLDTHLGINRETLLSLAISDTVLVLLRPHDPDRDGCSFLVQIAREVGVPSCQLVPSMIVEGADPVRIGAKLEQELGASVAGALLWYRELAEFGGQSLFALRRPDHPYTAEVERISQRFVPVVEAVRSVP